MTINAILIGPQVIRTARNRLFYFFFLPSKLFPGLKGSGQFRSYIPSSVFKRTLPSLKANLATMIAVLTSAVNKVMVHNSQETRKVLLSKKSVQDFYKGNPFLPKECLAALVTFQLRNKKGFCS